MSGDYDITPVRPIIHGCDLRQVRHYAALVTYHADEMLEKNRDFTSPDLLELMYGAQTNSHIDTQAHVLRDTRTHGHTDRDTGTQGQGHTDKGTQGLRDTRTQGLRDTGTQGRKDTGRQGAGTRRQRDRETRTQGHRDAGTQGHRDTERRDTAKQKTHGRT